MNKGIPLTLFVCCVWPVIFHLAMTYVLPLIIKRDWKNIRWDLMQWPWSKHE